MLVEHELSYIKYIWKVLIAINSASGPASTSDNSAPDVLTSLECVTYILKSPSAPYNIPSVLCFSTQDHLQRDLQGSLWH